MAVGFVLVKAEPGSERAVYQSLVGIPQVVEIFPLFGEYDFILKMEADSFDALGQALVAKVRSIHGVRSTKTYTVTSF